MYSTARLISIGTCHSKGRIGDVAGAPSEPVSATPYRATPKERGEARPLVPSPVRWPDFSRRRKRMAMGMARMGTPIKARIGPKWNACEGKTTIAGFSTKGNGPSKMRAGITIPANDAPSCLRWRFLISNHCNGLVRRSHERRQTMRESLDFPEARSQGLDLHRRTPTADPIPSGWRHYHKNRLTLVILSILLSLAPAFSRASFGISSIPEDCPAEREREDTYHKYPPEGYHAVILHMEAVTVSSQHDPQVDGPATVIVEDMSLIEKCGISSRTVPGLDFQGYPPGPLSSDDGGLYVRNPWFFGDEHTPIQNSMVHDGVLEIFVDQTPDSIAHWWTQRVAPVRSDCDYHGRVTMKIEGMASVKIGSDWWRSLDADYNGYHKGDCTESNNCLAWSSGWYGDTGGRFITVEVPLGSQPPIIHNLTVSAIGTARPWFFFQAVAEDPEGARLTYEWDFDGDGTADKIRNRPFALWNYDDSGPERAFCRVIDSTGLAVKAGPLPVATGR